MSHNFMCNEKKVPGCRALSMRRLRGRPHHWQQFLSLLIVIIIFIS